MAITFFDLCTFFEKTVNPLVSKLCQDVPWAKGYKSGVAIFDICFRSKIMRLTTLKTRLRHLVNLIFSDLEQISKIATSDLQPFGHGTSSQSLKTCGPTVFSKKVHEGAKISFEKIAFFCLNLTAKIVVLFWINLQYTEMCLYQFYQQLNTFARYCDAILVHVSYNVQNILRLTILA